MSKRKSTNKKLSFKEAVEQTPEISNGYKSGLLALGTYSKKVSIPADVSIEGSVDIDSETSALYPNDNRWDYAFSCAGQVYYIEVHSAITSEVSTVIKKLKWLKQWLASKAPELVRLTNHNKNPFYWVQSSNFQIPPHSPQYKVAVSNKIKPIPEWNYTKIINS